MADYSRAYQQSCCSGSILSGHATTCENHPLYSSYEYARKNQFSAVSYGEFHWNVFWECRMCYSLTQSMSRHREVCEVPVILYG